MCEYIHTILLSSRKEMDVDDGGNATELCCFRAEQGRAAVCSMTCQNH